jgi:two-component system sensor histidine kinase and response regulator WspE
MSDDFSMMDLFREEARAHAATLSQGLIDLEKEPASPKRIEPLMRAAHSIKGAARIVNIEPAVHLAHAMEDAFVAAQEGRIHLGPADIDVLLRGTDILAGLDQLGESDVAAWSAAHADGIASLQVQLRSLLSATRTASVPQPLPAPRTSAPSEVSVECTAQVVRVDDSTSDPSSSQTPVAVEAAPIEHKSSPEPAHVVAVRAPQEEKSALPGAVPGSPPADAVVRVAAHSLNRLMGLAGESLVHAHWLDPFASALLKLKKQHDRLSVILDQLNQALSAGGQSEQAASLIREARREASACRETLSERLREFQDHAASADDLNGRLYREVIASRMRPFADGAHGFPRLVRDMARRLDKLVNLQIEGQATEVDRDILEKLEAPLTHLLRNAVDHAIEPPAQRRQAGKPEAGSIRLEARHRAGMLVITVVDDGAGIDLEALRRKIVQRGLAPADMAHNLTEPELLEFLFLPGFSTAGAVTEYSGRGVGLDVVQSVIRKIGGSVSIQSRRGRGTTFVLKLPITLSVVRAVLVDIGGEPYAFPHNRIDRLLRVPFADVRSLENRQFITVDGSHIGLVLASQLFDMERPGAAEEVGELSMLLFSDATGQYGLIVDAIRGEQDLVVRPLDPRLGKVQNISAAASLDDGTPVLIADVEDLVRSMDQFIQGNKLRRCGEERDTPRPRKRILVVDDSITVRELERQLLRNHGYDVAVAVDGKEGWNLVRAQRFDLVITDVDMPRMNGLELVTAIRHDPALRDLPVIIVSYKEREEDRLRGSDVGANYYLTKSSFHDNTFIQAVSDLISEA